MAISQWTDSTFACFSDFSLCLDTFFCSPCQIGRQMSAVEGVNDTMNMMWCLLGCCFPACANIMLRNAVSTKFGLGENVVFLVLCGWCCAPCSLCQTGRELNARGHYPGGCCCKPVNKCAGGAVPPGMMMPPPGGAPYVPLPPPLPQQGGYAPQPMGYQPAPVDASAL